MNKGLEAFKRLVGWFGLPTETTPRQLCYDDKELVEKELKALEIIKEKNIDLKTLKIASICEADNKKQCEIYNANRWRWVEDNDFYGSSSVPSEDILEKEYELLKEVLL